MSTKLKDRASKSTQTDKPSITDRQMEHQTMVRPDMQTTHQKVRTIDRLYIVVDYTDITNTYC